MRQYTSAKTAKKYAARAGLNPDEVSHAMVRGGTNHRVDIIMKDGTKIEFYPTGSNIRKSTMSIKRLMWLYPDLYDVL